jgi:hypothetical protein
VDEQANENGYDGVVARLYENEQFSDTFHLLLWFPRFEDSHEVQGSCHDMLQKQLSGELLLISLLD